MSSDTPIKPLAASLDEETPAPYPQPDDGALMAICEQQIDWLAEKTAISRDTGKLALLSILMSVRDQANGGR